MSSAEKNNISMNLLGKKAQGLIEMASLGLSVPPGFIIPMGEEPLLQSKILDALRVLEKETGRVLGHPQKPLFLSLRSTSAISMPGMLDTFLNVGINDDTLNGLSAIVGDTAVATQIYVQFLKTYATRILRLSLSGQSKVPDFYQSCMHKKTGQPFTQNVVTHLFQMIKEVRNSWHNARAMAYRRHVQISQQENVAIIVQAMVFGNAPDSGTGVVFTRNPSTGQAHLFGEYIAQAQGEILVSGMQTPQPLSYLEEHQPHMYAQLKSAALQLESFYKDMQDIEFTVEKNHLWFLQTRSGKRTAQAAFKIAYDMMQEGLISTQEAFELIDKQTVKNIWHAKLASSTSLIFLAKGMAVSPGAATGVLSDQKKAEAYILLRPETTVEDIEAMMGAQGIITLKGGMTSHAAVVMRGVGKPCIVIDQALIEGALTQNNISLDTCMTGIPLTIDGHTGEIFLGRGQIIPAMPSQEAVHMIQLAHIMSSLKIHVNAETLEDLEAAQQFGILDVGLARTEHMMFEKERLRTLREIIIGFHHSAETIQASLEKLCHFQQQDFYRLLKKLKGHRFSVRLLDPPLHEFMKIGPEAKEWLAQMNISPQDLEKYCEKLHETNPMLGHRGCRLGISFPSLYSMQAKALFKAAYQCHQEGIATQLAILVPFVVDVKEFVTIKELIASQAIADISYQVGAMIEIPRAALLAGEIAMHADFISFGTNDLTQMTWGISRDESHFLKDYATLGIIDPFQQWDEKGTGYLIAHACHMSRRANPRITLCVCGEHAAQPQAIDFFKKIGIDAISCSPRNIPVACLAAARTESATILPFLEASL